MQEWERRRRARRAVSLLDERFEVEKVPAVLGPPAFLVRAAGPFGWRAVTSSADPVRAAVVAVLLERARSALAEAWAVAEGAELRELLELLERVEPPA